MSWNYRVVREDDTDGTQVWTIREVYYNEDGSIKAWSANPQDPMGTTLRELQENVGMFQRALTMRGLDVTSGQAVELTAISGRSIRKKEPR